MLRAQGGDGLALEALCRRYDRMATGQASAYDYPGAQRDDVRQEARIGLLNAVRSWRPEKRFEISFYYFAKLCIERQIITGLKTAQRVKHRPLSESARLGYDDAGEQVLLVDLLPSPYSLDPLQVVLARERLRALLTGIWRLTELERAAVLGVGGGVTYEQLAAATGRSAKAVDNATQRGRRKLAEAA